MSRAIRIHETGGPEVLRFEEVAVGDPGAGELRIRHTAIGVNYIDTYHRSGLYPLPALPTVLGMEGAGIVEAVGADVSGFAPGTRVAYAGARGSYSESRILPADRVVRLPDAVDDATAAAMMLKGMTAEYLIRRTFRVERGMTVLLHAAAGGVGLIACQWLAHLGATVIGTVGSDAKAELARRHGCHHPIVYTREDFVGRVRAITDGRGVPVVYDSVGKATFAGSLACLSKRGLMVSFGNASGPPDPVDPLALGRGGALYLTRPSLHHYTAERAELEESARALFEVVAAGVVKIHVGQTYPLAEAEVAHRALEGRATTGSTVLVP